MHFPYANNNAAGHCFYGTAVYPNIAVNYSPYFPYFCSNSNGLLPTSPQLSQKAMLERNKNQNNRQCKRIVPKASTNNISLPPCFISDKEKGDTTSNDFLTFIDQKTKPLSALNPFANEFSLEKTNNDNNKIIISNHEKNSSYKLIFDNLIEQSLQSIDAFKRVSKGVSVNHISTQCEKPTDQINSATQTHDDNDNNNNVQHDLLKEYSSSTVDLMNALLNKFKYLLLSSDENNLHNQLISMSHLLDELHYFILLINQSITSNKSSINRDNIFSNMIKDLAVQSSPIMFGTGRGRHRLISSSISCSSIPSVSSRQIDLIKIVGSKICMVCQKPIDDSDDVMHELCRLLLSPPDVQNSI